MKSNNWKNLIGLCKREEHEEFAFNARVYYMVTDLELPITGTIIPDAETTIVTVTDVYKNMFIGVSQCSPRDTYNRSLGREIAAGRLLKAMVEFKDGSIDPMDLHQFSVTNADGSYSRYVVFGNIPNFHVMSEVSSIIRDNVGPSLGDET